MWGDLSPFCPGVHGPAPPSSPRALGAAGHWSCSPGHLGGSLLSSVQVTEGHRMKALQALPPQPLVPEPMGRTLSGVIGSSGGKSLHSEDRDMRDGGRETEADRQRQRYTERDRQSQREKAKSQHSLSLPLTQAAALFPCHDNHQKCLKLPLPPSTSFPLPQTPWSPLSSTAASLKLLTPTVCPNNQPIKQLLKPMTWLLLVDIFLNSMVLFPNTSS